MDKHKRQNTPLSKQSLSTTSSEQQQRNLAAQGLTRAQVIATERQLAKFANMMDSIVRIPFTKQGVGADTALSTIPLAGDIAGLILTSYAFILGRRLGVPAQKMTPAVRLAILDMLVGVVPIVGTLMDVFIRPSRKTLDIVHQHLQSEYGISDSTHMDRPFLHQRLADKQQQSHFWRYPLTAWLYLHIPDILGVIVIGLLCWALWGVLRWLVGVFGALTGFG